MRFFEDMLAGGDNYVVVKTDDGATFTPAHDTLEAVRAFQTVVKRLQDNNGRGYMVYQTHRNSDLPGGLIDILIVLRI